MPGTILIGAQRHPPPAHHHADRRRRGGRPRRAAGRAGRPGGAGHLHRQPQGLGQRAPDHAVAQGARQARRALSRQQQDRHHRAWHRPGLRRQGRAARHPRAGPARPQDPGPEGRGGPARAQPPARQGLQPVAVRRRGGGRGVHDLCRGAAPADRRHLAVPVEGAPGRQAGAVRGRPGDHAGRRPRHLPLRDVVAGVGRRAGGRRRRPRRDPGGHRPGQGLHHQGGLRTAADRDRGLGRRGPQHPGGRVRHHHRAAAPLRLARHGGAALRGAAQRPYRAVPVQARRALQLRPDPGGHRLPDRRRGDRGLADDPDRGPPRRTRLRVFRRLERGHHRRHPLRGPPSSGTRLRGGDREAQRRAGDGCVRRPGARADAAPRVGRRRPGRGRRQERKGIVMRIAVIGGGAREHTLIEALALNPDAERLYAVPGNAGTAPRATNVQGIGITDAAALAAFVESEQVDLTVIGPEVPLVAGVADYFLDRGLAVFGPTAAAARIEGSKAFAKEVMAAAGVPTARAEVFDDAATAIGALDQFGPPWVIKADGLAAAQAAIEAAVVRRVHGDAGGRILLEEYLDGPEASVFALTDGRTVVPLAPARDYKRVADGDQGPNTGGMGAYSPLPDFPESLVEEVRRTILEPTVAELGARGIRYQGLLYAGLALTAAGPKVIEFNCRFGDPEAQVVVPRLATDLTEVLASGGYPGSYRRDFEIIGLPDAEAQPDVHVYHAGTTRDDAGVVRTAGGRVLAVTALGHDLAEARSRAYAAANLIHFDAIHYRRDIAALPPAH